MGHDRVAIKLINKSNLAVHVGAYSVDCTNASHVNCVIAERIM